MRNLALNAPRVQERTSSLGSLCQDFTSIRVKNFFLTYLVQITKFLLFPLKCPTAIRPCKKLLPLLHVSSLQVLQGHTHISLEPTLLQAEQIPLHQPFFTVNGLQPFDLLCGPPPNPLRTAPSAFLGDTQQASHT